MVKCWGDFIDMPMTRIMAYCFDHMIWFHWMTCKLDTMSSRDQSIAIGFLIRRDSKFSTNLVICQSVKQMLKLRLTLKYEAKMHKLTSNLYILASTFSVSFNFSIDFTLYWVTCFFGQNLLWPPLLRYLDKRERIQAMWEQYS